MNRRDETIGEIFAVDRNLDDVQVEIALQYKKDDFSEKIVTFVNNVLTPE